MPFVPLQTAEDATPAAPATPKKGFTPAAAYEPRPGFNPIGNYTAPTEPQPTAATTPERQFSEARALPAPGFFERLGSAYRRHEGLSQNALDLVLDRIPQFDPATGQLMTLDERREKRRRYEEYLRNREAVPEPQGFGDYTADVLGMMGKEIMDPAALMTGDIGAAASGLKRILSMAAAGGAYETLAGSLEQISDSGEITSGMDVAERGVLGAVGAPALDAVFRGVAAGIRRLRELRRQPGANTAEIDQATSDAVDYARQAGRDAGMDDEQILGELMRRTQTDDGRTVIEPDAELLQGGPLRAEPTGPNTPQPERPQGQMAPAQDAAKGQGGTGNVPPGSNGDFRQTGNQPDNVALTPDAAPALPYDPPDTRALRDQAAEYERMAETAQIPQVQADLRRQAQILREQAAGEQTPMSPGEKARQRAVRAKERARRARIVDPDKDDLITAIRKLGGIDTSFETDWEGRLRHLPREGFGLPAIERPGKGKGLDDLAEGLHELGYLTARDVQELEDLLLDAQFNKVWHPNVVAQQQIDALAPRPDEAAPASPADSDWSWQRLDDDLPEGADWVIDTDSATAVPGRPVTREDLERLTEEEINAAEWFKREADSLVDDGAIDGPAPGGTGGDRLPQGLADSVSRRDGDQPRPGEAGQLPGIEPRDEAAQALADAQRAVDSRRNGTRDAPVEAGDGDLFSGKSRQTDIEDVAPQPRVVKDSLTTEPNDAYTLRQRELERVDQAIARAEAEAQKWRDKNYKDNNRKLTFGDADTDRGEARGGRIVKSVGEVNEKRRQRMISAFSREAENFREMRIEIANGKRSLADFRDNYETNGALDSFEHWFGAAPTPRPEAWTPRPKQPDSPESNDLTDIFESLFGEADSGRGVSKSLPKKLSVGGVSRSTENADGRAIHSSEENVKNFWRWFGDSTTVDQQRRPIVFYHGTREDFDQFRPSGQARGLIFFTDDAKQAGEYAIGERSGYSDLAHQEDLVGLRLVARALPDLFDGVHLKAGADKSTLLDAFFETDTGFAHTLAKRLEADEISAAEAIRRFNADVDERLRLGAVMPVYLRVKNAAGSRDNPVPWREAEKKGARQYKAEGFDAVWVTEGDGVALAVVDSGQAKSAVGNRGTFNAEDKRVADATEYKLRSPQGRDVPYTPGAAAGDEAGQAQVFLPADAPQAAHDSALTTFGRRVRQVRTGSMPVGIERVQSAADAAHVVAPLRRDAQESVAAVITDADGQVLAVANLHRGDQMSVGIDPAIIAGAITRTPGAARAWLAHNHPSGATLQSEADTQLSERLAELLRGTGVDYQGSLVVAPGGKFSHQPPGGPQSAEALPTAAPRRQGAPVTERRLVGKGSQQEPIDLMEEAHAALTRLGGKRDGVLLLDADRRPVGFLPLSEAEMRTMRTGSGGASERLLAAIDETGAEGFIVRTDSEAAAGNLNGFAAQTGRRMIDAIKHNGDSLEASPNGVPNQSTFYANPFWQAPLQIAKDVGLHPGRSASSALFGGVGGATVSDEEPGSARWWLDVGAGAAVGVGGFSTARRLKLLGEGSILEQWRADAGRYIDGLPFIGRGPEELRELKRKQRNFRQILDRQTEAVGKALAENFSPAERAMMADLIETRGIVKDLNVIHRQAAALDDYLTQAAERMKDLGMLPEELQTGGYLHRYYAKHLGLDGNFRKAKGQTLSGSYSIARGTDDLFGKQYLSDAARARLDELDAIRAELRELEKTRGDLLEPDTAARIAELKRQRRDLQQIELREYVGVQNGKPTSFLFLSTEVPRVGGNGKPVFAAKHQPRAGEIDPRAMPEAPGVEDLATTDRKWFLRGTDPKGRALLHRDWTKAERQAWGEIEDAGYRYVRGMAEASHDLSLATLYKTVAARADWVSDTPRATRRGREWVLVPDTKVNKGSPLKKYGALAGKYVRPDVWAGMQGYGRSALGESRAAKLYQGALSRWKLYKTVYNPVTHMNNTFSNVEMLFMGGYSGADLARGLKHMRQGEQSKYWTEARDAGLFGTDWSTSLLAPEGGGNRGLDDLAEQLRTQSEIPDAELVVDTMTRIKEWWINSANAVKGADTKLKTGAELAKAATDPLMRGLRMAKKPVDAAALSAQRLYRWEDEVFKMAVYQAERKAGKSVEDAVIAAERYFFDYNDLPQGLKLVRDLPIGSPFISYTYFAAQAMVRNAVQRPEHVLALAAAYEAWNYGMLVADGMSPGEYWAVENAEEELSPAWDKGRAIWGAKNTVHLPFPESYRLALGRAHALGNPFMTEAGGREVLPTAPYITNFWGSSLAGGNPLHALLDVAVNEDWKGKQIYKPGAPNDEKFAKSLAYLYQSWSPSNPLMPGSYHQVKLLEGMANDARQSREAGEPEGIPGAVVTAANEVAELLGMEGFTGLDRADNEIVTRDALLGSVGVKLRPIRFEQSIDFEGSRTAKEQKKLQDWFRDKSRKASEGRLTDDQVDAAQRSLDERTDKTFEAIDRKDQARRVLRDAGLNRP